MYITEDVQEDLIDGLIDDDYDMYYEMWHQFDPDGTQYIRYDQLSLFLEVLEPPLRIHRPNKYKIVSLDIPICKGDLMFCVDILDALTLDFFARQGYVIEHPAELNARPNELAYVSSTLWRQREEYCVRVIQNAWRKHKRQRGGFTDQSDGGGGNRDGEVDGQGDGDGEGDLEAHQTAGPKNGHNVVLHSHTPTLSSRSADSRVALNENC